MKKLFNISLILVLMPLANLHAQATTDKMSPLNFGNSYGLVWYGADLDSAETIWSQDFRVSDYDGFNTSNQVIASITAIDTVGGVDTLIVTSYGDAVKPQIGYRYTLDAGNSTVLVNVYHYVNYIHPDSTSDWIIADTLASITGETVGKAEVDLNNVKAPFHKIAADNLDTGQSGTLNFGFYNPKKEGY